MEFKGAKVIILKEGGEKMIKPFHVDDNYVTIQMASSSLVTREDIVMRIHGMEGLSPAIYAPNVVLVSG